MMEKILYHYCNDCKYDVDEPDLAKHEGHKTIPVHEGEPDPSLAEDFRKNGLSLEKDQKPKESEKEIKRPSKKAHDLATGAISKIVINENNSDEVYALISNNSHTETLDLSSQRARYWLNDLYHKKIDSNEIHSDELFKTVLNSIISRAQMNGTARVKVYARIAQLENEIWYDLGTQDWQAFSS